MKNDKAIVILDNFWDANFIINCGFVIFPCDKEKCYKINFCGKSDFNYSVYSIALRHPAIDKKLSCLHGITTLDFFCPTYDMLKRYKNDGNWELYTKDYYNLMGNRKKEVREWIESLMPNHIYLLCCWENTSLKAKCHRQLLFNAFNHSKLFNEKAISFYCHGERKIGTEDNAFQENPNINTIIMPGNYVVTSYA
jgi:hypothetical protein